MRVYEQSLKKKQNNAFSFCENDKVSSPFKFYPDINLRYSKDSKLPQTPNKHRSSSKKTQQNDSVRRSFVNTVNTSTSIKKENQIYVRSLEEFIESNIKCINDLIEYKQSTNFAVIEINARCRNISADVEFETKKNSQLKTEITNVLNANNTICNQNKDMLNKVSAIREKLSSREAKYSKIIDEVEYQLNQKKIEVNAVLMDIEQTKEETYIFNKEAKQQIKELELAILESEKQICKLEESIDISKKYEAHRLQILRDKQKILGEVICKDSFQYF